ncbi:MAG: histidine--tRNA ligase [Oscillospiraceae bacterium]|nr:histidine--tRNA ligase [Candidatus Equicaccousia limihippi]
MKTPVKGMCDFTPEDMVLRNYVTDKIKQVYGKFGFTQIETPAVEHIENLTGNHGGENEKLIFKILKRGEKLNEAQDLSTACDCGLRYDLTLPLSRFYANNQDKLYSPFKAFQIGNVWRADRPQKGRFRQFCQCDIDILGDDSILAETELITATATLLKELGFENFTVRINDRATLKEIAENSGISQQDTAGAFISLDKLDKIGEDGVREELISQGISATAADAFLQNNKNAKPNENILNIQNNVAASGCDGFKIEFDPTLVRGMGYYTGTIFEITMEELGLSVAGGGRYDEMIGSFSGANTPACGFSIGFERIITILKDRGFKVPTQSEKIAFLIDKKADGEKIAAALSEAASLRSDGKTVMVTKKNKNSKFQKENLAALGYTEFKEIY